MPTMNGGQALIQSLAHHDIDTVFGLPGAGQYEAVDALYSEPRVRYIATRHEQATSYMADGFARASGRIAAAMVVPGPGLLNATAGMVTAHAVSSPMLLITGSGRVGAHGVDGELVALQALAGWVTRADSPGEIPGAVAAAVQRLRGGRPRPAALQVPGTVLAATADVQFPAVPTVMPPEPVAAQIEQAASLLARARRPAIWAGAGVHRAGAGAALQSLAERLQAPVVTSSEGKGALSDRHPLSLGLAELRYPPLRDWLQQRDLILAVGTSRDFSAFEQQIVQIDIDAAEIASAAQICAVVGDARRALEELMAALQGNEPAGQPVRAVQSPVQAEVRSINGARFDPTTQLQPQWDYMCAIRAAMPDDGVLVQDMNQMGYYSRNYYPVYSTRSYLTCSSYGTLGSGYPIALGAKVAQPERAVVALCGDGGFLYNSQELATAVQYGIHAVVIVFNDNAYGNVLRAQMEEFDGHVIGTRLHNPDFVALAQAYGARGVRAESATQLEEALRTAQAVAAPTLIEVPVGRLDRVY